MKTLFLLKISFIVALGVFLGACSDNESKTDNVQSYAVFFQEQLTIPASAGEVIVMMGWSCTSWEIVMDADIGMITKISQTQGGNSDDVSNQYAQITFQYNENSTSETRKQEIFLINKTTKERFKLVIEQESHYLSLPITLDANIKYQHVVGFGGMYNPKIWTPSNLITDTEITKMYSVDGLGYNILRLMVYPNESDWGADVRGAKLAQQYGAIIFASPWDCTDAFADEVVVNGSEHKHLKHEHYQDYANHLIKYINYMKDNGVNLYAISVQNEPDMDFTFWYPQEVVDFVKEYGDQIRTTGVKLMAPEACGMSPEYTDPILNDAAAFAQTDIVAGHLYQGFVKINESSYVKNRHDYICGLYNSRLASAGKTWWMTEHLFNDGEGESNPALWQFRDWSYNMENLAQEIHMSMEGYCSAYIYWYLKRFYGMIGDNDSRSPVALGDVAKNGYILSHYAQYASDMVRINVDTGDPEVEATAYVNHQETEITIVLLNMKNQGFNAQINYPSALNSVIAVETTEDKNMENIETHIADDKKSVTVFLSANGITSVRLTLE